MPSGPLRRRLRAAGHHLAPIVQVGKGGVTEPVNRQLAQALDDHELVKVKIGAESPVDRIEAAELLSAGTAAQVAQILGHTLLLYRRHPKKPRFEPQVELPGAAAPSAHPGRKPPRGRDSRRKAKRP